MCIVGVALRNIWSHVAFILLTGAKRKSQGINGDTAHAIFILSLPRVSDNASKKQAWQKFRLVDIYGETTNWGTPGHCIVQGWIVQFWFNSTL